MKKKLLLLGSVISSTLIGYAQEWDYLGSPGFSNSEVYECIIEVYNDIPFVAYTTDGNAINLKKFNGTYWESIGDENFANGRSLSLAFDESGTPLLAFRDYNFYFSASVLKFENNQWSYLGSPSISPERANNISLTIQNNLPVIAYTNDYGDLDGYISALKFESNNWSYIGSNTIGKGGAKDLIVDNYGFLLLAYEDSENSNKTTVIREIDDSWDIVGNSGFGYFNYHSEHDLELSSSGTIYLTMNAFVGNPGSSDKRAQTYILDQNSWNSIGGYVGGYTAEVSMVVSQNDAPIVTFEDVDIGWKASTVIYDNSEESWEFLGNQGYTMEEVGSSLNSAIDNNGTVYVCFMDEINQFKLSVMKFESSNLNSLTKHSFTKSNKNITQLTDLQGKKTKPKSNTPLFYIYDDGTVEKRIVIE